MEQKLYEILEGFERDDGSLCRYDDKGSIAEAIEEAFAEAGFEPDAYDVVSNVVFSCPSADFGYVSVAWVEDGKLYHQNYEFE